MGIYETKSVRGVNVKIYRFNPYAEKLSLSVGAKNRDLERLEDIYKYGEVTVAKANAGFFSDGYRDHMGALICDGVVIEKPWSSSYNELLLVYKDKKMEIKRLDDFNFAYVNNYDWIMGVSSYSLVKNGVAEVDFCFTEDKNNSDIIGSHIRTMLGQKADKEILIVISTTSITPDESSKIMKELECINAVNLDGGGSSQMIVLNKDEAKLQKKAYGDGRLIGSALMVYSKNILPEQYPVIGPGSTGEYVKHAQYLLKRAGKDIGSYGPLGDGIDGDLSSGGKTYTAIREFQDANGLIVDGWVGENTWTELLK